MMSPRCASGAKIWDPMMTCCLTCSNSSGLSGPCLLITASRVPILPMSCRRPATLTCSTCSSASPSWCAIVADRSATRGECPRMYGSFASSPVSRASRGETLRAQLLQRVFARSGRVHLELLLLQELLERVPNRLLVVHDEDLDGAPSPCAPAASGHLGHSGLLA